MTGPRKYKARAAPISDETIIWMSLSHIHHRERKDRRERHGERRNEERRNRELLAGFFLRRLLLPPFIGISSSEAAKRSQQLCACGRSPGPRLFATESLEATRSAEQLVFLPDVAAECVMVQRSSAVRIVASKSISHGCLLHWAGCPFPWRRRHRR